MVWTRALGGLRMHKVVTPPSAAREALDPDDSPTAEEPTESTSVEDRDQQQAA